MKSPFDMRMLGLLAVFAAMWIAVLIVVAGLGALTDWVLA